MNDWLQKALDVVHLAGNGVGFGLPDWIAGKATGNPGGVAANTARAQANLGAVGDVITGAGNVFGAVRGAGLAKSAFKAVPALLAAAPVAEAAAADAGATGSAFRAELAARQAMNPSPLAVAARTVTSPKMLATGIGAAGAAGLANAGRTGLQDPAAAAIAASSPIAGGPSYEELSKRANAAQAASVAADAKALPAGTLGPAPTDGPQNAFSHILDNFSGAGGGMSLHELAILSQAQAHSRSPLYGYQKKPQTAYDAAGVKLNEVNDAMWEKASKEISAMPAGKEKDAAFAKELAAHQQRLETAAKLNTQQAAMGAMLGGAAPTLAD